VAKGSDRTSTAEPKRTHRPNGAWKRSRDCEKGRRREGKKETQEEEEEEEVTPEGMDKERAIKTDLVWDKRSDKSQCERERERDGEGRVWCGVCARNLWTV
jgi:hypothetical protein